MAACRVGGGGGDCLIKLFGKTIPVPEAAAAASVAEADNKDIQQSDSSTTELKGQENTLQDSTGSPPQQEVADTEDSSAAKNSSGDQQQGETANQKEKLKKPDKILPCPRCNSMDTKFCYYNNYNINQPRHFCKNCQRYWTAGGAMRNVPVGAGRRKSKSASAASHFLQRVRAALPIDPLCTAAKTNGTVLSFGSDMSLDLTEQMKHLKEKLVPITRIKSSDDRSVGSCTEGSAKGEDSNQMNQKEKVIADKSANVAQHPCMNGVTMWPFSCAPPLASYTSGIAIPFYPAAAAYWGCMVPGAWNTAPWQPHSQSESASSLSTASPASTKSNCFTPGKRPRDSDEGDTMPTGKVWVPKTIRIDDADEVARSSILSLIGINGDKAGKDRRGCKLASVFEQKEEAKTATHAVINSLPFLQGNPAALSRSLTFQEGS
ncbi:Cyclic dof factor 2 [Dichanthelium oligosanthes]|uniref:Cyclic dof factor 2 n=1 Tax=Dichanthelium oligosanthes TaxID=888268 RepID=A0A1E5VWB7_9POAL|nr:Cyclic dof factor 2 [Dichanthelium oligosanthes]